MKVPANVSRKRFLEKRENWMSSRFVDIDFGHEQKLDIADNGISTLMSFRSKMSVILLIRLYERKDFLVGRGLLASELVTREGKDLKTWIIQI